MLGTFFLVLCSKKISLKRHGQIYGMTKVNFERLMATKQEENRVSLQTIHSVKTNPIPSRLLASTTLTNSLGRSVDHILEHTNAAVKFRCHICHQSSHYNIAGWRILWTSSLTIRQGTKSYDNALSSLGCTVQETVRPRPAVENLGRVWIVEMTVMEEDIQRFFCYQ